MLPLVQRLVPHPYLLAMARNLSPKPCFSYMYYFLLYVLFDNLTVPQLLSTSNRDRPAAAEHHQAIPKLLSKHHDCWCCGTIILRYITIADAETGRGRTIMQTVRHP